MQPWKEEAPMLQPREIELGEQLLQEMALETFDISRYKDNYVGALRSLIDAKMAGEPLAAPTIETKQVTVSTDLIGQLMASVKVKGERAKRSFDFDEERTAGQKKR
jgi:non-homologous end joining protein Ku